MKDKFGIIYCSNLHREMEAAIPDEMRNEVLLKPYDSHNANVFDGSMSSDEAFSVLSPNCDSVCLFGCGCPTPLNPPPFVEQSSMKVNVRKGAELFLPPNVVKQLYREGAYVVTAGWVNEWRRNLQSHFPDLDVARQLFSESIKEIVLLDTGLYPDINVRFKELTGSLSIPGRIIEAGLDHLSMLIENRFLNWKMVKERDEFEFSLRESGKKLADHIMVSDFLGVIARLQDEKKLILKIEEIYTLLMSPEHFSFLPHPFDEDSSEWKRIKENFEFPEEENFKLSGFHINRKKNGFICVVSFQEDLLGIIHVDGLAFPRYLNDYINTSRFVAGVFALALYNSSIYRKLNDTILELDSEISARRKAQELLVISNRNLNLLTSITRHDMNNYLAVQLGYLELFDRSNLESKGLDYLNKIENAAEQMAIMINFTKEYEEIGAESAKWHNVREIVDGAKAKLKPCKVSISNEVPPGLEIFSDQLIGKVFYNLMENATRHGENITYIKFSYQYGEGHSIIVCEDNGQGVSDDKKEKIFNRGFGKNTGLGLFLSKEILSITGLGIREAGEFGIGARFEISLPEHAYRGICELN